MIVKKYPTIAEIIALRKKRKKKKKLGYGGTHYVPGGTIPVGETGGGEGSG